MQTTHPNPTPTPDAPHCVSSSIHLSVSSPPDPSASICSFAALPFAALSPRDTHLLSAIFDPNSDLLVAAAHAGVSETEMLDWFAQPHIQHYITTQRALRRLRHEIREECLARRTLDTLNELASIADDPIERRRAATAILRYLLPSAPRRHRARSASEAPSEPREPSPQPPHTPGEPAARTPAAPEPPTARPAAPPPLPTAPENGTPAEPERQRTPTPPSQTLYYTVAEPARVGASAGTRRSRPLMEDSG